MAGLRGQHDRYIQQFRKINYLCNWMIETRDNIDNWIGRFFTFIFLFCLLLITTNDSNSNTDCQNISLEQIVDINNSATLVKPASLPDYNVSFENCIRFDIESWKNKFDLTISNKIVNQQFKTEELRFYEFKPNLLRLQLSYLQFTSTLDYLLIS